MTAEKIGYGFAHKINLAFPHRDKILIRNLNIGEHYTFIFHLITARRDDRKFAKEERKIVVKYTILFGRVITTIVWFVKNRESSYLGLRVIEWQPVLPK
jgi:hypothetical protein